MMASMIPDGWSEMPLGKLGRYINGRAFKPSEWETFGLPIIRIQNLNDPTKPYNYFSGKVDEKYYVKKGDLLVAWSASLGDYIWNGDDAILNQHIFRVEVNEAKVTKYFLYYAIRHSLQDIMRETHGMGMKHITKGKFEAIKVPVPNSLHEQKRIVARLDALLGEVREMRALAQSMQADIERVMDAVYEEAYPGRYDVLPKGWEMKTFPEVCEINPRRPRIQRNPDEPTSFVPMAAVDEITGSITGMETVPYQKVRSGYRYFENGDVLFAKITPSMQNGKAAIADGLIDGFGFGSTEFHILRPKSGILSDWIYHYIRRKKFRREAQQRFRGAAGQQRVPQDFLETHEIPVPHPNDPEKSLNTQRLLVRRFNAVKEEVVQMKRSVDEDLNKLDVLEQSILAAAFRGEL